MCGIFGQISKDKINRKKFSQLVKHSKQRGVDSSGLIHFKENNYKVHRADYNIEKLLKEVKPYDSKIVLGHSRLITNGLADNQPVFRKNIGVLHNGIITNEKEVWSTLTVEKQLKIDTEAIVAIAEEHLSQKKDFNELKDVILSRCEGIIACALFLPELGKLILFSNNGSLYVGQIKSDTYFASENYALSKIGCKNILQIKNNYKIFDIPPVLKNQKISINDQNSRKENLIPEFQFNNNEESLLLYEKRDLIRCTKCILPHTMPFIKFDRDGICNYCNNYVKRNKPKPKDILFELVKPYRKTKDQLDCIVPFSGGRDSCFGLHLIVHELKMKPVTYTYDWGMVTDLGRRNISRVCSKLGVENIIVAADISKKRRNIRLNLQAWLKSPHLGMMAMLTAGDKHFFRHVETIKRQTNINLNLWGVNPLEQTHFKAGFLGIPPDFGEDKVYINGIAKQLRYHSKRFKAMSESIGYFNRSLFDTLSGEYYRSFMKKEDYFHIFDFWEWEEQIINETLINQYNWETAIDTPTTWRIGDGTAGFYNYVYYTAAGFTEHDTFRSNQIREGQLKRNEALALVEEENRPRYQNIRWYLDTLSLDFSETIKVVNKMKKLF